VQGIDLSPNGLPRIVASWFISPVLAGVIASAIFLGTRIAVLKQADSLVRGLRAVPIYFGVVFTVCFLYVLLEGPRTEDISACKCTPKFFISHYLISLDVTLPLSLGLGALVVLLAHFFLVNWLKRKLVYEENVTLRHLFVAPFIGPRPQLIEQEKMELEEAQNSDFRPQEPKSGGILQRILNFFMHGINQEIADHDADELREMHEQATRYDDKTEYLYSFLQIMTASFASFAHG
jgi:sodium-dependent phosphate transporter